MIFKDKELTPTPNNTSNPIPWGGEPKSVRLKLSIELFQNNYYLGCWLSSYHLKNDRNGGIWQSGISKSLVEYVQRPMCFVNVQSSLHDNVVFSVCARMDNAAYIMFIMWNSISGLDAWYHFRFNISCDVAVTVRSHQKNFR